jgi:eukaryotic-like serine/threonine-protein kinase
MPFAPDLTGSVLDDRYELLAVIGEGAFGRVYRGRDRRLGRTVAIKVIKPWWSEDPEWAESFEREAQLLARMSDPGIVQIFDVGHADEGVYYVEEYVDGQSLAERLRHGPLLPAEACEVAEQLCRALGSAHGERIVHRDVKPANVLLSARRGVKVGDFGVARLAESSTGGGTATIVGTPRYMAPEQSQGSAGTPATDVYSVGVVLYEMLAGQTPFHGDSPVELALAHLNEPPPPLPRGVPRDLARAVDRALAKDPARRYQSGEEMAVALARVGGQLRLDPGAARARSKRSGGFAPAGVAPELSGGPAATRVAPRLSGRRNVNPAARRRSVVALAFALGVLAAMVAGALALRPGPKVRVPSLRGENRAQISATGRRLHLRIAFVTAPSTVTPGLAIAQAPAPGRRIPPGSRLTATLSGGPPPVELPRLTGQSTGAALSILGSLGLHATVTRVPAPGHTPGTVLRQSPAAAGYVAAHGHVGLVVAETPSWRTVTSFTGDGPGSSGTVPVRGERWRLVYTMAFQGTCNLIFWCSGPSAQVLRLSGGSAIDQFGLQDGGQRTREFRSGPGQYEILIASGSDDARWSVQVQDLY